jgi:hypothetical protein
MNIKLTDFEVREIYYALNLVPQGKYVGLRHLKLTYELRHILAKISTSIEPVFNTTEESRKSIEKDFLIEKKNGMDESVKIIDPLRNDEYNNCLTELFKKSENEFSITPIPFSLIKKVEMSLWQEQALEKIIDFNA